MFDDIISFFCGGCSQKKSKSHQAPSVPLLPLYTSTSRFFSLPLELRIQIYYYALLRPQEAVFIDPDAIIVKWPGECPHDYDWWGSERMSRLLRVNNQIYHEATAVLYTKFMFCFPHYCSTQSVHLFLDPLSARIHGLIRWLGLTITLDMRSFSPGWAPAQWAEAFALLARSLPDLWTVNLCVGFVGGPASEALCDHLVQQVLDIAKPFRGIRSLILEGDDKIKWPDRAEVVQRCRERIQAGSW